MLGHGFAYKNKFDLIRTLIGLPRSTPAALLDFPGTYIASLANEEASKYFTNWRAQSNARSMASDILREAAGLKLSHCIDMGGVLAASIFGGEIIYDAKKALEIAPAISSPDDISKLAARIDGMSIEEAGLAPRLFEWRHYLKVNEGFKTSFTLKLPGPVTVAKQICGAENFDLWVKSRPQKMFDLAGVIRRTLIRLVHCLRRRTGSPIPFLIVEETEMARLNSDEYHEIFWRASRSITMTLALSPSFVSYRAVGVRGDLLNFVARLSPRIAQISDSDPHEIAKYLSRPILWGFVEPDFLLESNPDEIKTEIKNKFSSLQNAGVKTLLSTNAPIADGTPLENIAAMLNSFD